MKSHVDLSTGKIFGCKKGSWKWYHEKGHLVFNLDPNKSFLILLKGFIFNFWMLFVMAAIVIDNWPYYVAIILWLSYVGIGLYEEWWCNQYANRNYKQTNRNGPKKKGR